MTPGVASRRLPPLRLAAVAALLAVIAAAARADEAEPGAPVGPLAAPPVLGAGSGTARLPELIGGRVRGLELRVVELPAREIGGFGRPRRPHHALSFRSEAPRHWLQSIGVDATDCTTRVRFPSRFGPSADGSGLAAEVAAQVHFSCRF